MVKKTNPTGVRFDIEQLAFVKGREKLQSPQEVVNFLLRAYWDVWHVPKNPFNAPVPEEPQKKELPNKIVRGFDYYLTQIKELELDQECKDFALEVQASGLSESQKKTLLERLKSKWV